MDMFKLQLNHMQKNRHTKAYKLRYIAHTHDIYIYIYIYIYDTHTYAAHIWCLNRNGQHKRYIHLTHNNHTFKQMVHPHVWDIHIVQTHYVEKMSG